MGNYCYIAVSSVALGASAPTEEGEGRGHIVAAARLQLVYSTLLLGPKCLDIACWMIAAGWPLFLAEKFKDFQGPSQPFPKPIAL